VLAAQLTPLAHEADTRSFAAHMAQHLLIGDLAPLTIAIAFSGVAVRGLNPAVSLPLWLANLALWHVPVVYEAALHHVGLHALQHVALLVGGVLLWAPVFELARTPRWFGDGGRLIYLLVTMFGGVAIAAVFLWWPRTIYSTYAHTDGFAGLSPHADQRAGGGLMLIEGSLVTLSVAGWIVWRLFTRVEPDAFRSP
jgi:cytochrome c oxidase assembly factor CtaG